MATAALSALASRGVRISGGVVAYHEGAPPAPGEPEEVPAGVVLRPGAHQLPDEGSLEAGAAVHQLLGDAGVRDVVLVLLSGGASAVMELLPAGLSLAALRRTTEALQQAGADIGELNTVRRALSRLKGGGLARLASPARGVTVALSDVVGDRTEVIGSGPTVPSPTGPAEALGILEQRGLAVELPEVNALFRAALDRAPEPDLSPGLYRVIASNRHAAEAVARTALARGFRAQVMTTSLEGEAREAGRSIGACAANVATHSLPFGPPACLIFGGETTVTVRGKGRGGAIRNWRSARRSRSRARHARRS